MPHYFIKTYGCQMNIADSDKLAGVLESAGYKVAANAKQADVVLINTCVVRQNAEDRAAWYITSAKGLKNSNPNVKIIVCGCMVSEPGRNPQKSFPHVDLFIPPHSPDVLIKYLNLHSSFVIRHSLVPSSVEGSFVSIMTGCDNFCSYCVVPYVRGREYSRPMDEVLAEIKGLLDQGVTDITLLGQNVNSYKYGLAKLLIEIDKILSKPHPLDPPLHLRWRGGNPSEAREGVRMHFLTSHPKDLSDQIIESVANLPFVAKEFFLPLQSGDDVILQKMNRGYTLEYYLGRINKIRSLMPNATIITDLMVGFPGETEEQFQNTLDVVKKVKFNVINMFAYSARPNTSASKMPDQLPEEEIQERLQRLINLNRQTVK